MRRLVAVAVSALVCMGALAGCSMPFTNSHTGTAAIVNGQKISELEVSQLVSDAPISYGKAITPTQALVNLSYAKLVMPALQKAGLGVTKEQEIAYIRTLIVQQQEQLKQMVKAGNPQEQIAKLPIMKLDANTYVPPQATLEALAPALIQQEISDGKAKVANINELNASLNAAITKSHIEFNPRYGSLNKQGGLKPTSFPWIKMAPAVLGGKPGEAGTQVPNEEGGQSDAGNNSQSEQGNN